MPRIALPEAGRPFVIVEPGGETGLAMLDEDAIVTLYRAHGALLFRGFAADVAALRGFARRFCKTAVVNESPGRTPLDPAAQIFSVNAGEDPFALHPELSREPWKPDAAFFACLATAPGGGAITVCDGIALVEALPDEVRQGLAGRRLVYPAPAWPNVLEYWLGSASPDEALLRDPPPACPYRFGRDGQGRWFRYFSRPALHRPMFDARPAFGNFLLFARYNNGRGDFPLLDDFTPVPPAWVEAAKAAGDATMAAVDWRVGDLLMLDNTRFMHGRTAITAPAERLIATYFGYLRFAAPDPEEPADPIWRREDFMPPLGALHPNAQARA